MADVFNGNAAQEEDDRDSTHHEADADLNEADYVVTS
jgi:hypothetical protein